MITRRRLLGLGAAISTAASATKAFALRLPHLGFAAQAAKPADISKGKIYYKGDSRYEIYRLNATWNARKPNRFPNAIVLAENVNDVIAGVKLAKERGWQVSVRSEATASPARTRATTPS